MGGWGLGPWGGAPWGLAALAVSSVSPAVVPDEGGVELTVLGTFPPATACVVTIGSVACPCPRLLGGVDGVGGLPGTGPRPRSSLDGSTLTCVVPQLPPGVYDLTVQPDGHPVATLPAAVTSVRRDWSTRLHSLRRAFPTPPYPPAAVGATSVRRESAVPPLAGQSTPELEGLIHTTAGALLEADGVVYTRLVPAPFTPGIAAVQSTAPGDAGTSVEITGRTVGQTEVVETVVLPAGAIATTVAWDAIHSIELSAPCSGTVSISDGGAIPAIALRPGRMFKAAGALEPGDTEIYVEGCFRFPATGVAALRGERVAYSAKTVSPAYNRLTCAAVTLPHSNAEVVADVTRTTSGMDLARGALAVGTAAEDQLTAFGRRHGVRRSQRVVVDETFRSLVRGLAYSRRGSLLAVEQLLDEVYGSGAYVVEDPIAFTETEIAGSVIRTAIAAPGRPGVVWIVPGISLSASAAPFGRAYLCGGEPATTTGAFAVTTARPPTLVYGVYLATDTRRLNNLCDLVSAPADLTTNPGGAGTDRIGSAAGAFLAADVGKGIILRGMASARSNRTWQVVGFIGAGVLQVAGRTRQDGLVDGGTLDVLEIETSTPWGACPFQPDDVGLQVEVSAGAAWAPTTRTISAYLDRRHVRLSVALPGAASGLSWAFLPTFPVEAGGTWELQRNSVAGSNVTLARTAGGAGVAVLLDYTTLPSAALLPDLATRNIPSGAYWPLYLFGGESWLLDYVEDLVPAGWRVLLGDPHL